MEAFTLLGGTAKEGGFQNRDQGAEAWRRQISMPPKDHLHVSAGPGSISCLRRERVPCHLQAE